MNSGKKCVRSRFGPEPFKSVGRSSYFSSGPTRQQKVIQSVCPRKQERESRVITLESVH